MAMSNCRECGKSVSTLAKTCPHCGVPKPVKKIKKVSKKTKPNKKNKDKIWVHCRDYKCKDYTQMYQIYKDYLDLDRCNLCKSMFMEAKIINGRPVMPTDGTYGKSRNKRAETYSQKTSYTSSNSNYSSSEKGAYDKFLDGNLDLATAFWVFGIFGSFIASIVLTLIAENFSKIFYIGFFAVNAGIIACLWECAENYKKEKLQKKQSAVWGYLTQVFCVFGALGLISTAYDIITTL